MEEAKEFFWWLTINGENIPIHAGTKDAVVRAVSEASLNLNDRTYFPVLYEFQDIHDGAHIIDLKMAMSFDESTPELREARLRHAQDLTSEFPDFS